MKYEMSKVDMLFVRACKSKNPSQRVRSVYRRFYLRVEYPRTSDLLVILSRLSDEHLNLKFADIFRYMPWLDDKLDFEEKLLVIVINKIMLSERSEWPDSMVWKKM